MRKIPADLTDEEFAARVEAEDKKSIAAGVLSLVGMATAAAVFQSTEGNQTDKPNPQKPTAATTERHQPEQDEIPDAKVQEPVAKPNSETFRAR